MFKYFAVLIAMLTIFAATPVSAQTTLKNADEITNGYIAAREYLAKQERNLERLAFANRARLSQAGRMLQEMEGKLAEFSIQAGRLGFDLGELAFTTGKINPQKWLSTTQSTLGFLVALADIAVKDAGLSALLEDIRKTNDQIAVAANDIGQRQRLLEDTVAEARKVGLLPPNRVTDTETPIIITSPARPMVQNETETQPVLPESGPAAEEAAWLAEAGPNGLATMQRKLDSLGYTIGATSQTVGPKTRQALKAFQSAGRLMTHGFFDRASIALLTSSNAPRNPLPQAVAEAGNRTVTKHERLRETFMSRCKPHGSRRYCECNFDVIAPQFDNEQMALFMTIMTDRAKAERDMTVYAGLKGMEWLFSTKALMERLQGEMVARCGTS